MGPPVVLLYIWISFFFIWPVRMFHIELIAFSDFFFFFVNLFVLKKKSCIHKVRKMGKMQ